MNWCSICWWIIRASNIIYVYDNRQIRGAAISDANRGLIELWGQASQLVAACHLVVGLFNNKKIKVWT